MEAGGTRQLQVVEEMSFPRLMFFSGWTTFVPSYIRLSDGCLWSVGILVAHLFEATELLVSAAILIS